MASTKWKSFEEINEKIRNRNYYYWGATFWIEKAKNKLIKEPISIIDKNPNNYGIKYAGSKVLMPKDVDFNLKPFIIITTANYNSVINDLENLNMVMGEDFCCSPDLMDKKGIDEINNINYNVLFTSPEHFSNENSGGGIYNLETSSKKINKLYSGKVRGITKIKDGFCFIDMLKGLVITDNKFKINNIIELTENSEPHGLFTEGHIAYVGTSGRDSVSIYDFKKNEKLDEIFISNKWNENKKDNHHLNDIIKRGNSIFVSMFSFSGNWQNEIYDGGVIEIDLNDKKIQNPVYSKKWMPHSISIFDNKFHLLDSMRGELFSGTENIIFKSNGFLRGLEKINSYYLIAQTPLRYPEKVFNLKISISVDTGIHIINPETKFTRFFNVDQTNSIHSILKYED